MTAGTFKNTSNISLCDVLTGLETEAQPSAISMCLTRSC